MSAAGYECIGGVAPSTKASPGSMRTSSAAAGPSAGSSTPGSGVSRPDPCHAGKRHPDQSPWHLAVRSDLQHDCCRLRSAPGDPSLQMCIRDRKIYLPAVLGMSETTSEKRILSKEEVTRTVKSNTTAELSEEQKNEISHRGKALRAMKEKLAKENL